MHTYKAINTSLGELYGRDCIYLSKVNYDHKQRVLNLKGHINNYISDKTLLDTKFSKYILTFTDVLALKVLELDSWEEIMDYDDYMNIESSFVEVLNSSWIKKLGGKVTSDYHHYIIQTYDDVFEVVSLNYHFPLEEYEEKLVKKFVKAWLLFYDDLNEKKGINEEKLNNLYDVMEDLEKLVAKKGAISIDVASIFIDLYSSIEALAYIYEEEDRQKIFEVADNLAGVARDICHS